MDLDNFPQSDLSNCRLLDGVVETLEEESCQDQVWNISIFAEYIFGIKIARLYYLLASQPKLSRLTFKLEPVLHFETSCLIIVLK